MLIPLRGKVLVKILEDTRKTESGLWIVDKIEEVPHRGLIVSLGLPYRDAKGRIHEWDIKIGEIIHFKRNWENRGNHFVLKREDIFAVEDPLRAVRDLVLVKRVYTGKIGRSTLALPEMDAIRSNMEEYYGLVISVGIENTMGITVGDRLCYQRNEGIEIKLENREVYWSLKTRAVLAKISENNASEAS